MQDRRPRFAWFPQRRLLRVGLFFFLSFLFASQAQAIFIDGGSFDFGKCPTPGSNYSSQSIQNANTQCDNSAGMFSQAMCIFESSMLEAMIRVDCALEQKAKKPVAIAIAIYLTVLGVAFLTGMMQLSSKDAALAVFKVALVWAFTTHAAFAFQYGYGFFAGFAQQGTTLMLTLSDEPTTAPPPGCPPPPKRTGSSFVTQPDREILDVMDYANTDEANPGKGCSLPSAYSSMPPVCRAFIITMIVLALLLLPLLSLFILYGLWSYFSLFLRALLGYLSALFLLSFLFVMAPIFVSFALFNVTRELFSKWLQYLGTFAVQMVIVFAFFAMINLFNFDQSISQVASLVRKNPEAYGVAWISYIPFLTSPCSLCDMELKAIKNSYGEVTGSEPVCKKPEKVLPILGIIKRSDFLTWLLVKLFAVIIITMVLKDFLKKAPELAQKLGRVRYAAVVGGDSMGNAPNLKFAGLHIIDSAKETFTKGFRRGTPLKVVGLAPLSAWRGVKELIGEDTSELRKLRKQEKNQSESLQSARKRTIVAQGILQSTLRKGVTETKAKVAFNTAIYKAADLYEKRQARKLSEIQQLILSHKINRGFNSSAAHEIRELGDHQAMTQAGAQVEREDEAAKQWYNTLTPLLGAQTARDIEREHFEVLKDRATSLSSDIRHSSVYQNLSAADRLEMDRQLSHLKNVSTYKNPDALSDAIYNAMQQAKSLGINV